MPDATEQNNLVRLFEQWKLENNKTTKVSIVRTRKALLQIQKFCKEERKRLLDHFKTLKPLSPEERKERREAKEMAKIEAREAKLKARALKKEVKAKEKAERRAVKEAKLLNKALGLEPPPLLRSSSVVVE